MDMHIEILMDSHCSPWALCPDILHTFTDIRNTRYWTLIFPSCLFLQKCSS